MKKQKATKTAVAAVAPVVVESSTPQEVPNTPQGEVKTMVLTLKKTKVNKAGEVYFSFGAGSIRMSKSVFVADATLPEALTLEVPEGVFAPAGVIRAGGGGGAKMTAERLAKVLGIATKQAERAAKAKAKAAKALAAAKKAGIEVPEATEAPAEAEATA